MIPHRGKKLLQLDFSHCALDQTESVIEEARKFIQAQPPGSLLVYSDLTGTLAVPQAALALRDFAKDNAPFVKASVAVGLRGPTRLVLNAINRFTKRQIEVFDDPVVAKNWLVEQ
jgi:hypothetical protein